MSKVDYLINYLLSERNDLGNIAISENEQDKFRLYRSLVNIRPAVKADDNFLQAEDEYLTALTERKGITDIADLTPVEEGIYLWKGDIQQRFSKLEPVHIGGMCGFSGKI